jgi:hypothetical protein
MIKNLQKKVYKFQLKYSLKKYTKNTKKLVSYFVVGVSVQITTFLFLRTLTDSGLLTNN